MNRTANGPLVSIALATYNGEKYLPQLLDSLRRQTYPNIEIVAVDDVSTDNTIGILKSFNCEPFRLTVYANDKNLGYVKNFEKVISLCNGDFIAPCDQDDYWLPDKIKRKVEEIGDYPMIYCDSFVTDENLALTGKRISDAVECNTFTSCLNYSVFANVYGHASMFRRSLFLSAPHFPLCITHDWWLAFNATLHGGVKFLPETLIKYRQHPKNLFGIIGNKRKKHNEQKRSKDQFDQRERIRVFYDKCPDHLAREKKVLYQLKKSYESFSVQNNFLRMITFFANYRSLMAVRKRNTLRKWLFCCKMFVQLK